MTREKVPTSLRKFCRKVPLLYQLFCTGKTEHVKLKRFFGFSYGIVLGIIFYQFILVDLSFSHEAGLIVGAVICLMLALGITFSSQIRCITCLTFPNFGGKVGRSVLKAIVITFVISGPVENLTANGKEVVRVFSCTASLTFNLTKTRFELMFKPLCSSNLRDENRRERSQRYLEVNQGCIGSYYGRNRRRIRNEKD
ncbi:hypothetical protein JTB14_023149 [Gonioctena quinquepunctata]|nr:hypothetical protein JTB14_023149 [Gonioctena quinquepunctata]